eukprot:4758666-Amphidinium_carterae.1
MKLERVAKAIDLSKVTCHAIHCQGAPIHLQVRLGHRQLTSSADSKTVIAAHVFSPLRVASFGLTRAASNVTPRSGSMIGM